MLQDEVNFALSQIRLHMRSPEAEERMLRWSENECPDNDNLERLHQLQVSSESILINPILELFNISWCQHDGNRDTRGGNISYWFDLI